MTSKWHGGKGDRPRKGRRDDLYREGWDTIFNNKDSKSKRDSVGGGLDQDSQDGYRVGDVHKAKR